MITLRYSYAAVAKSMVEIACNHINKTGATTEIKVIDESINKGRILVKADSDQQVKDVERLMEGEGLLARLFDRYYP